VAGEVATRVQCSGTAVTKGRRCARKAPLGHSECTTHRTPGPLPAVTASTSLVQLEGAAWQNWRFGNRQWQNEAWRLYDLTGQLRFVAGWQANSVSRCRLYVAEVDESGEAGEETTNQDIAALAAVPLGQGPAKDESLRLAALHLFVPGESFFIVEAEAGDDGEDRWMVVTGRQISRHADQITIKRPQFAGGGVMLYRPGVDLIIRAYTPHPADSDEPDSPTRSALSDLRELEAIKKREFAELDSRLAGAGILLLPQGIEFPTSPDDPPGTPGLTAVLQRAMATSLRDRSSAAALVPILAKVPPETVDKIKHLTFWSELSEALLPMRESAIRSLAQSLDVPAEILTGIADTNHWNLWGINADVIRTQIVPTLSRIADALTTGYLRGALEVMGEDPTRYAFAFDTAPLTVKPDRSADALSYFNAGLISGEAAVESGSFRPDQIPNDEERKRRLAERLLPALPADPVLRELVGIAPAPEPEPAPEPAPEPEEEEEPEEDDEGPPDTEEDAEQGDKRETPATAGAVTAVAGLAMVRALSLAGGRLVPHTRRDQYAGTPRHQLHTAVGPVDRGQADKVLAGAWDDLEHVAADLDVDVTALRRSLHEFAASLLTSGHGYDPASLRRYVDSAVRSGYLALPLGVAA
jgi:hypothetical protein